MIQESFGKRIKELRSISLISQEELSKKSGIDRTQLSKIEKGKINVTLETIYKLSKALGESFKNIFDFEDKTELKPFVKWAGGKTQIISKLKEYLPKEYNNYFEPFVGGGALLLNLEPKSGTINDSNQELVYVYECLMNDNLFNKMIEELIKHEENHNEEYYYQVRSMDQDDNFSNLPKYIRAARMIYLNKSCFNGLYRVNSKGYFNVPSGHKIKVNTFDRDNMENLRLFFKNNKINIFCGDYKSSVKNAKEGDFVYFDPPYDTLDDKQSFTSYSKDSFGKDEQEELANVFKELSSKGVKVMLSNHNTKFINDLYEGFNIHVIEAKRMINRNANGRGNVEEVIITNY